MEELSPYISGGTVVVLQKKTKAEIAQDTDHMNRFQKRRNLHRGNKAYKDFLVFRTFEFSDIYDCYFCPLQLNIRILAC